jgi:hypothetical protein
MAIHIFAQLYPTITIIIFHRVPFDFSLIFQCKKLATKIPLLLQCIVVMFIQKRLVCLSSIVHIIFMLFETVHDHLYQCTNNLWILQFLIFTRAGFFLFISRNKCSLLEKLWWSNILVHLIPIRVTWKKNWIFINLFEHVDSIRAGNFLFVFLKWLWKNTHANQRNHVHQIVYTI